MKENLPQQNADNKSDFLAGDVVVLDETFRNGAFESFDELYYVLDVYEHMVCLQIRFGKLTLSKKLVRNASIVELNAKRRLALAEQSLGEVS